MNTSESKIMDLSTAVGCYVRDGSHISIGGFTLNRNPMAAVYEIIRQDIKDLHLYAHSNGQGVDELIGAGCVTKLEIAYAGSGRFAPTCIRFRKAVEIGTLTLSMSWMPGTKRIDRPISVALPTASSTASMPEIFLM